MIHMTASCSCWQTRAKHIGEVLLLEMSVSLALGSALSVCRVLMLSDI